MARTYTLRRRAESQAETRLRIVEAAVKLHGTLGPAHTSISMVAQEAGVQRHTFYAHFPDERSLLMACSGLAAERDPMPDAASWQGIADRRERLKTGLAAIYTWYERNAGLLTCVLRDAEHHALVREVSELRYGPYFSAYHQVLGAKMNARQRALLQLALSFFTWRSLTQDSGLGRAAAVAAMVAAIFGDPKAD